MFKPMLADSAKLEILRFPLYASPKVDGLRCTVHPSMEDRRPVLMSRRMQAFPNKWLQNWAGARPELIGLDGELVVGPPTAPDAFRRSTSFIMSNDKTTYPFTFHVFDKHDLPGLGYSGRLGELRRLPLDARVVLLPAMLLHGQDELDAYEVECLEAGYEGVMTRTPSGLYKQGRATARGQELLKVKRSADMEAVIVGAAEQMHNTNDKVVNAHTGRSLRGQSAEGLVGKDTLGALIVRGLNGPYAGIEFAVGTGFDDAERKAIWDQRTQYAGSGKIAKVGYFPLGSKDRPRHPTWLGLRDPKDMDER